MKVLLWCLGGAAWGFAAVVLIVLCVFGGADSPHGIDVPSAAAARYDHRAKAWTAAPPMVVARTHHAATVLSDGSVLIAGGEEHAPFAVEAVPSRSSEIWRPERARGSRAGALASEARQSVMLPLSGGRAVLVGGVGVSAPLVASPGASVWRQGAPYGQTVWADFGAALQPDGKVLLVHGRDAETWDPATEAWTRVAAQPWETSAVVLVALADGRMLLVGEGGPNRNTYDFQPSTQFQVWTPSAGTWEVLGSWPGTGYVHRAVQLTGGEVLVLREPIGGSNEATLWDPATGRLTPVSAPAADVRYSTLTALSDGLALHVGAPAPELWSGAHDGWSKLAAPPGSPLRNHVAVRLTDGDVLIAGGDLEEKHTDPLSMWMLGGGVFGLLVLLAAAAAAIRFLRPSAAVLVAAIVVACGVAGVLGLGLYAMSVIGHMD